ncbi:pre-rRNA processing protein Esf1 [Blumeria hordei DH14]|uniref:Pre-rRNA processing protein Esf1 n=1 Tax=Blumeria graminis f. sp. hordei (strain DH14) TaxID=546991 RepID=N1J9R8_BLUG1|nr:pre-rRNA processing protein Esf1 [Blumeria hordei DH14]
MSKSRPSRKDGSTDPITDSRFKALETDPRFRLPSKKHTRTKLDKRFSRILTDSDFHNSTTADRYGRRLKKGEKKKALERLYLPEDANEDETQTESKGRKNNLDAKDYETSSAGKLIEGSEEESSNIKGRSSKFSPDSDTDATDAVHPKNYDPARGGGFSSSEDDDSDEEENLEDKLDDDNEAEFPDIRAAQTDVPMGEVSSRFAVVNLDWDNINSEDLFTVFSSFLPPGGKIHEISIYPSEFGKERMDREEIEGPPKEIFAQEGLDNLSTNDESEEDEEIAHSLQKPDEGREYNDSALRKYQLERLSYYYAVVTCSSPSTAHAIYEATDGREYLSSANFFDLRFIPDGVEFTEKERDKCLTLPTMYRPTEFVTNALQHSKVKLTWDTDPSENTRKEAIKRAFSGSRSEINENDLRAYLCSDTETEGEKNDLIEEAPHCSKKELARQKMRAALGLEDEESPVDPKKSDKKVGDMEITFTAGLESPHTKSIFQNEPIKEETTAERYVRLERERKARRKERAKARREGRDPDLAADEENPSEAIDSKSQKDLGFDDPFFTVGDDAKSASKPKSSQRKAERLAKRQAKEAEAEKLAMEKTQLELLMHENNSGDEGRQLNHFDINEIARAEKKRKRKGIKGPTEIGKRGGLQEDFEMDVHDPRFGRVFESHEYAIDPSHPRFKGTDGMKKLLEAGRKRRRVTEDDAEVDMARRN